MTYSKCECYLNSPSILLRMPHVTINVGKDGMTTPWRHKKSDGKGEDKPIFRKKISFCWVSE